MLRTPYLTAEHAEGAESFDFFVCAFSAPSAVKYHIRLSLIRLQRSRDFTKVVGEAFHLEMPGFIIRRAEDR